MTSLAKTGSGYLIHQTSMQSNEGRSLGAMARGRKIKPSASIGSLTKMPHKQTFTNPQPGASLIVCWTATMLPYSRMVQRGVEKPTQSLALSRHLG